MPERLRSGKKVVGAKQTAQAIRASRAQIVYLARDADRKVTGTVLELAAENGIEVVDILNMEELGRACGIDVKAAVAAIVNE